MAAKILLQRLETNKKANAEEIKKTMGSITKIYFHLGDCEFGWKNFKASMEQYKKGLVLVQDKETIVATLVKMAKSYKLLKDKKQTSSLKTVALLLDPSNKEAQAIKD